MPVLFADAFRRVKARAPELEDERIEQLVLEAAAAFGLEVAPNGEVYNPAEGSYRPAPTRVVPRDQRFSARRRR